MHKGVNALLELNVETFMPWRTHAALGHIVSGFQWI